MAVANLKTFGGTEMIQIAEAVGREKGIDREAVLSAMENAIASAGRRKYGSEKNIQAEIDRRTGEIQLFRVTDVTEDDAETEEGFDDNLHITVTKAQRRNPGAKAGEEIRDLLPPIDFGRIAAQTAKQVIVQKVRDAEREVQFDEFKDRVGEIVSGVVKRVEYGNVIVDFGRTEAVIYRDELIPREVFRTGDRIRAYIHDVRREKTGPQIFLSRVRPEFMAKLFAQEVPEIYDGIIQVKAVARDPGSRAKIAVYSRDSSVNPVLSCVGVRGARVQAVVGELQGERIDIVLWAPDQATFIVNALSSAEVSKVVMDEDTNRVEVVVPEDQLSLAIGRRGQNVRLASMLTGWNIDMITDEEESNRRAEEFNTLSALFTEALDVEEVISQLLVTEGFRSIEEVAYVPLEDLEGIEGFDESVAYELQARAREWLDTQKAATQNRMKELGVQQDLLDLEGLNDTILVQLAENGVKTLDDFAELSRDEFTDFVPKSGMDNATIDALIMKARAHWFEGEEASNA